MEYLVKSKDEQISILEKIDINKDEQIQIQHDWIERLLKYTELLKEDLQKIIKKDKERVGITKEFLDYVGMFCKFGI